MATRAKSISARTVDDLSRSISWWPSRPRRNRRKNRAGNMQRRLASVYLKIAARESCTDRYGIRFKQRESRTGITCSTRSSRDGVIVEGEEMLH